MPSFYVTAFFVELFRKCNSRFSGPACNAMDFYHNFDEFDLQSRLTLTCLWRIPLIDRIQSCGGLPATCKMFTPIHDVVGISAVDWGPKWRIRAGDSGLTPLLYLPWMMMTLSLLGGANESMPTLTQMDNQRR
jgi:hypothetical protein